MEHFDNWGWIGWGGAWRKEEGQEALLIWERENGDYTNCLLYTSDAADDYSV
mgnify:CR=1 FL=1